jgi:UDP-glucose 4-epimerase
MTMPDRSCSFEGRRVLVTGGAGFIGSHLVARLLERGARVTVLDDLSSGARANLPSADDVRWLEGCVTDARLVRSAGPADLVVHLAGVVGMRLAWRERERAFRIADTGTRTLLAETGPAPVLLCSSSAVYGLDAATPSSERVRIDPAALLDYDGGAPGYGSGKWRLEQLGREAARAGRPILIVRPFNVVGPRQTGAYGMVLPTFVDRALHRLPLQVHDDGKQTRCFSDIGTFTECLVRLVSAPDGWAAGGRTMNVGTTVPTAIGELAQMVVEETGSGAGIEFIPYTSTFPGHRDVRARIPDIRRLRALLGEVEWPGVRGVVRDVIESQRASELQRA